MLIMSDYKEGLLFHIINKGKKTQEILFLYCSFDCKSLVTPFNVRS